MTVALLTRIHLPRKPYPLNWEEQERLFNMLPAHLRRMALFAVNTDGKWSSLIFQQLEPSNGNKDSEILHLTLYPYRNLIFKVAHR